MIGVGTTIFLVNPTTFPSGFTNEKSLLFDGVDEYVNCNNVTMLQSCSTASLSFWIKAITLTGNEYPMGKYGGAASDQFYVDKINLTGQIAMHIGNATSNGLGYTTNGISTSVWSHVAIVFDGTLTGNSNRLKIYLNGSLETLTFSGTIPSSTTATSIDWGVGAIGGATSSNFAGYIDEHSIFDYALTGTQITSIFNSGVPTDLSNTSGVTAPVHWWRMGDGDTYPTINDVGTTGGNNGTMTNMESGDIVTDVP